jgi:outer membrane receptor protein involved in Fe transport
MRQPILLVVATLAALSATALAQSTTSGAIQGVITDQSTGEKLAGVTVTVASPALQGVQTAITDENGFYKISDLPAGEYTVTFYYLEITVSRPNQSVGVSKTTPVFQKIDTGKAKGEKVIINDTAPTIDPTSTTQGITIDKNYMKNVPVPGRTFEATIGAAAGSQNDGLGISFSGSSSLENQYYVDGVNTTGLTYGTVGTPVINDFIEEIEVLTGGYNAEFGRATGGVVSVVTKSGSNELKGSVFSYFQPGILTYDAVTTPRNAASIDTSTNLSYDTDVGFEVGGPIKKDKLWFYVGFAPRFVQYDTTRVTKRQIDCTVVQADGSISDCDNRLQARGGHADGQPDLDPETGFFLTENLDEETRSSTSRAFNILGKINYAYNPEHQGQLAIQALPSHSYSPASFGPATTGFIGDNLTTDISAKWTSKFNDNKTEVEAVIGWHRDQLKSDAFDDQLANTPLQVLADGSLGVWGPGFGESGVTNKGCKDGPPLGADPDPNGDKYPYLQNNCPMDTIPYYIGGPGSLLNDTEQRRSAKLGVTQRVKAAGSHEFKAGIDIEDNTSDKIRAYSGGAFVQNFVAESTVFVNRWVQLLGPMDTTPPEGRFDNRCSTPDPNGGGATGGGVLEFTCDYLGGEVGDAGTQIFGNTQNWATYVRDSWQIQPNLTLNAGLRYEEQRLRYADFLQNTTDPLTGNALGKNAMVLQGLLAPRVGLLYDWTKEGRSKVYASFGRFYESIPMDINDRSFGGEVNFQQRFGASGGMCGMTDPKIGSVNGANCISDAAMGDQEQLIGASGVLIAPGIKPQYLDEAVLGFEFEVLDDLKVGLAYKNRRLGRVIEDVSTDGANTYVIANPGEWSEKDEEELADRINRTDDPIEKARLQKQLELFQGIRIFDKPTRDYNALEFTLTRRFSKRLYLQASYTFSRTVGNYPGLISYDNGQVDPNISSTYDLIELLANRQGPLQTDTPHSIKVDGYYTFDFKKNGTLTVGARVRAKSGTPRNAYGGHYLYGSDESMLLPRGILGRTDFNHGIDLQVGYGRKLNKNMTLEAFITLYNLYNEQNEFYTDDTYAPYFRLANPDGTGGGQQNANPVSGGTYEDLIWVKAIDTNGNETPNPVGTNPNFGKTTVRYAPGYARFGLRLSF